MARRNKVGEEFQTSKGGVITVVARTDIKKDNKYVYILECSICSKDKELWPYGSITTNRVGALSHACICGCSSHTYWSEEQYKIICSRYAEKEGFEFLGLEGTFQGNTTRIKFKSRYESFVESKIPINSFLSGQRGMYYGSKINSLKSQKPDVELIDRFLSTGKFRKGTVFGRSLETNKGGRGKLWGYYCPICSVDEYVSENLCSGVFYGVGSDLSRGQLSCRCGNYYWSEGQYRYKVDKVLDKIKGTFTQWVGIGRVTSNTKFKWLCECGTTNITPMYPFLQHGQGCTKCSDSSGFKVSKPASLYIFEWYGFGESYLKYGITNREVNVRVSEQARVSSLDYKEVSIHHFEYGQDALNIENAIKSIYGKKGVCPKRWLPDGFTETVEFTEHNLDIINNIIFTYNKEN